MIDLEERNTILQIVDDVVITAAHCVINRRFDEDTIVVLAGVLDLRFRGGVTRKIKETHVHPKYEESILMISYC